MRINWKTITAGLIILVLALFVLPMPGDEQPDPQRDAQNKGATEVKIKQQIVEQDVELTESLCRNHCRLDLEQALQTRGEGKQTTLAEMQHHRPHIK